MNPAVSVVIPVYGSATILPSLAERLEKSLSACVGPDAFEVVLVHDRGPDNAWAVIEALGQSRPWLRAIELRKNAGQHNAIMAGLSMAHGRFIVTMDDDLQHDPDDIPRGLEALEHADLCYVQFQSRQHAPWKRLGSGRSS
jgi:undecaprenyl-phosphate 4-deoxy-4-formamido-L-arabinose transferase